MNKELVRKFWHIWFHRPFVSNFDMPYFLHSHGILRIGSLVKKEDWVDFDKGYFYVLDDKYLYVTIRRKSWDRVEKYCGFAFPLDFVSSVLALGFLPSGGPPKEQMCPHFKSWFDREMDKLVDS